MVPKGWNRIALEKIAEVRSGVAKGKKGLKAPIEAPYLRVANVQDGHVDLTEVKTIEIEQDKLERYSLKYGDVLMNEGGDYDKLGRGDVWLGQIEPCLHQNHVFAVRPNQDIVDSFFLAALAASNYGKTYFLSCAKRSTNLASINSTQIKEFPVLVPPLSEQKKIAQILSTWDNAITTTEQLLANSQQQKKALAQQLLTGKKRFSEFSGNWNQTKLGDVVTIKKGKALNGKDLIDGEYPVIAGGKTSPYNHHEFTDENVITVSASGAYAGYVAHHPNKIWASDCSVLYASENPTTTFIYQLLKHQQNRLYSLQSGGAQPHVYPKDLGNLTVHMPNSLQEQQKIASVLSTADQKISALEQQISHLKTEKRALMQQLLTGKCRVKID